MTDETALLSAESPRSCGVTTVVGGRRDNPWNFFSKLFNVKNQEDEKREAGENQELKHKNTGWLDNQDKLATDEQRSEIHGG